MSKRNEIYIKASLLSSGVSFTKQAMQAITSAYLYKRRVYGNPDEPISANLQIPQEIIIDDHIIANVIWNPASFNIVDYRDSSFCLTNGPLAINREIRFTQTPHFYDLTLPNGIRVKDTITYIFGHTLGVFVNNQCSFANHQNTCHFCSIDVNKQRPEAIPPLLNDDHIMEAIKIALTHDIQAVDSIFISGGNIHTDVNKNFLHYANLAKRISNDLRAYDKPIQVMLNVFAPSDLELLQELQNQNINILISTEAFHEKAFMKYCPGKSKQLSKEHLHKTLKRLVDILGHNHVFSIVIHGLDKGADLLYGIQAYADLGVCTIVNELHLDPHTVLYNNHHKVPSVESMLSLVSYVSKIYAEYGFLSYQKYGGRSSFDGECSLGLIY